MFTTFLEPFVCVLYSDKTHSATREGNAYAKKSCEISQVLELKNPSMWQEESAVVETLYIIFCSPKITNLRSDKPQMLLLPKVTRVVYKSDDEYKT